MGWRPLMEALPQARIYAPDLRGYPGTDQPRTGYDVFTLNGRREGFDRIAQPGSTDARNA